MASRRPASALLSGALLILAAADARADAASCAADHERGQQLQASGRFREARLRFVACGVDACPAAVRRDCARFSEALAEKMPSIVIGVRDGRGRDVVDVQVTIDGMPAGERLDGKAIPLDPGERTVELDAPGMAPVRAKLLVREGERGRIVDFVMTPRGEVSAPGPTPPAPAPAPAEARPKEAESSGPGVLPWVAVGVGAAAVVGGTALWVIGLQTEPANCETATRRCFRQPGESDASFSARQEKAGDADQFQTIGIGTLVAGGVVAVGGLVWYLVAPRKSPGKPAPAVSFVPGTSAVFRF